MDYRKILLKRIENKIIKPEPFLSLFHTGMKAHAVRRPRE
jgi:hypothetical protein